MGTVTLLVPTWPLAKHPSATKAYEMDLSELIPSGATIATSVWVATVAEGTDATPSAIISGTADLTSDPVVAHLLTAGTDGVTYCLTSTNVLSNGETVIGVAKLVVDDGC